MLSKSAAVAALIGTTQSAKVSTNTERPVMIVADIPDQFETPMSDEALT
jgi:SpoU rRNA methylase family enzyme